MTTQLLARHLAPHGKALRRWGFASLALFGSVVQGTAGPESDIDLLYEFEAGQSSLEALLDLEALVGRMTGRRVHLVSRKYLHPLLRDRILQEAEYLLAPLP